MSTTAKEAEVRKPIHQVSEEEARQVAEAARETEWSAPSFVRELFLGRLNLYANTIPVPPAGISPARPATRDDRRIRLAEPERALAVSI